MASVQWPTVDELLTRSFMYLGQARRAVAKLPKDDPDRKIFLVGEWGNRCRFVRAANPDRAKLVGLADLCDDEAGLWELREPDSLPAGLMASCYIATANGCHRGDERFKAPGLALLEAISTAHHPGFEATGVTEETALDKFYATLNRRERKAVGFAEPEIEEIEPEVVV